MKKLTVYCFLLFFLLVVSGCAGMSTYPARPNEPRGVRVYPQKIYLFVDKDNKISKLLSLPDFKNAYDIKPWSFLSKHDFKITIEGAYVKELTSNQDSSAALTLLQKIAELAAEKIPSPSKAMMDSDINSSFGFETGIYELTETGVFKKVSP
jgi:hypothetical protein